MPSANFSPGIDDALRFIIGCIRHPQTEGYSTFGYEVFLPIVVHRYMKEVCQVTDHGFLANDPRAIALSPAFYEAGWELCRRGILRPGIRRMGAQGTAEGASGDGYSITQFGRSWLAAGSEELSFSTDPSRFSQIAERFRSRLGEGYFQRAQEAARCHFSMAYLACCVMCGAAAESILLRIAIEKSEDEAQVLSTYRSAQGRGRVLTSVVGQLPQPVASKLRSLMELIGYLRDEAAHGGDSDISEFEAYEAVARLLRLAHFANEHWDDLTRH